MPNPLGRLGSARFSADGLVPYSRAGQRRTVGSVYAMVVLATGRCKGCPAEPSSACSWLDHCARPNMALQPASGAGPGSAALRRYLAPLAASRNCEQMLEITDIHPVEELVSPIEAVKPTDLIVVCCPRHL